MTADSRLASLHSPTNRAKRRWGRSQPQSTDLEPSGGNLGVSVVPDHRSKTATGSGGIWGTSERDLRITASGMYEKARSGSGVERLRHQSKRSLVTFAELPILWMLPLERWNVAGIAVVQWRSSSIPKGIRPALRCRGRALRRRTCEGVVRRAYRG